MLNQIKVKNSDEDDGLKGILNHQWKNDFNVNGHKHYWSLKMQFGLKYGVLYYCWEEPVSSWLLFVPLVQLKDFALFQKYGSKFGDHLDNDTTMVKIRHSCDSGTKIHWTVKNTANPVQCSKCEKSNRSKQAQLGKFHSAYLLNQIHTDLTGKVKPASSSDIFWILILVDQ